MKGDFSRRMFDSRRHYSSVRMQQGRVLLDADWNEQADIAQHRLQSQTRDIIGPCGAPLDSAAFGIVLDPTLLPLEEQEHLTELGLLPLAPNDFLLSGGHYYVDGLLCEAEHANTYSAQPHLPEPTAIEGAGLYVVYLDVWQRHVTALDDANLREIALGGPDTTSREQVIWQVKLAGPTPETGSCGSEFSALTAALAPSSGLLSAETIQPPEAQDPCEIPPTAGYRGRENQLYRVEVHRGGTLGTMTVKWSRENGAIVTRVTGIDVASNRISVADIGRDAVRGFAPGQWVELIDDARELHGVPGDLVLILSVDPATRRITVDPQGHDLGAQSSANLKLRRWDHLDGDGDGVLAGAELRLEHGILVRFFAPGTDDQDGVYKTGDYWLIPARSANAEASSGSIQWPEQGGAPLRALPGGVLHHYCRLGILRWDGSAFLPWTTEPIIGDPRVEDCRPLFPALTDLILLSYLGGDGQEVMPRLLADPPQRPELPASLRVGVTNGGVPVADAPVHFQLVAGSGDGRLLAIGSTTEATALVVRTDADGVAAVRWQLDPSLVFPTQQVEAQLLHAPGALTSTATDNPAIVWTAKLSIAAEVAYDSREGCLALDGVDNVQDAIATLCSNLDRFYYLGGDGQEVQVQGSAPYPVAHELRVGVAHGTLPIDGVRIRFRVLDSDGDGVPEGLVHDADLPPASAAAVVQVASAGGVARARWLLAAAPARQRVEASLVDNPTNLPPIIFTAGLASSDTCVDVVATAGADLQALFDAVPAGQALCVCLRAGDYPLGQPVVVRGRPVVEIHGCGPATRLLGAASLETVLRIEDCGAVAVRDLAVRANGTQSPQLNGALTIRRCASATVERVSLACGSASTRRVACLRIEGDPDPNAPACDIQVRSTRIQAGYEQVGMLLLDVGSALIEDNQVGVASDARPPSLLTLLEDASQRSAFRRRFLDHIAITNLAGRFPDHISRTRFDPPRSPLRLHITDFRVGSRNTRFAADPRLDREWWAGEFARHPVPQVLSTNARGLRTHMERVAQISLDMGVEALSRQPRPPLSVLLQGPPPVRLLALLERDQGFHGGQGIVVGGARALQLQTVPDTNPAGQIVTRAVVRPAALLRRAPEIRVLNNRVQGYAQGIHVALSARRSKQQLRTYNVIIADNTVSVVRPDAMRERHGIFVGSSQSTSIRGNLVQVLNPVYPAPNNEAPGAAALPIEGIRVYGTLGPLLLIRENHIVEFSTGVFVRALNFNERANSLWSIADNITPGAIRPKFSDPAGL